MLMVRDLPTAALDDLGNDRTRIIKPDFNRNAADIFKYSPHTFQKAFGILTVVQLNISSIAVRKADSQIFTRTVMVSVLDKIGSTEVCLGLSGMVYEGNVILLFVKVQFLLFDRYIIGSKAIAAVVSLCFLFQTLVDPPCSVPLLPGSFFVIFQSFIDERFEWIKF